MRHLMRRYVTVDLGAVAAILLGVGVAVAVLIAWPKHEAGPITLRTLHDRFGPKRYSELNEELVIRHFFGDREYGVFVDVGSGHYLQGSNTYFLEQELHWRGLAVDANDEYADGYARQRPQTRFFSLFVSDTSNQDAEFFLAVNARTRSSGVEQAMDGAGQVVRRQVRTVTLNDLIGAASITRFDFLSMDIELGEPAALEGFDIRRFRPALVCVEAHEPVRDALLNYFEKNQYRRLDEYLQVDARNWYFTPR